MLEILVDLFPWKLIVEERSSKLEFTVTHGNVYLWKSFINMFQIDELIYSQYITNILRDKCDEATFSSHVFWMYWVYGFSLKFHWHFYEMRSFEILYYSFETFIANIYLLKSHT